jgi:Icc-related predicted phosphoesterase
MKIALASDLHLEIRTIELNNTENADVLILAGDIMTGIDLHDHGDIYKHAPPAGSNVIWKLGDSQKRAYEYHQFLAHVSEQFPHVVQIAGNHEFYKGVYPDAYEWMKTKCNEFPNIHFLNKDSVDLGDITFVGATLWTDMHKSDPTTLHLIAGMMNDFRIIRNSKKNYRRFSPEDAVSDHHDALQYILKTVDADPSKRYVVIGHHAPTAMSVHQRYKTEHYANGGYYSDLSESILDRPQIALWCHGHMHDPFDYMMGDTRVVCNPRGYAGYEPQAKDFALKYLDI